MSEECKIIYFVSCYPAVSHTFIYNEIKKLRNLGVQIDVASVNESNYAKDHLDGALREEVDKTFYLKRQGLSGALKGVIKSLIFSPIRFFKALFFTWSFVRSMKKPLKFFLGYFAEACIFAAWLRQKQASHVHIHFGNVAASIALIAKQLQPFDISLTIHGSDIFYDETLEGLKAKYQAAAWIRCISFYTQSQVLRLVPATEWDKAAVVRMGVEIPAFNPAQPSSKSSATRVVCIGRLLQAKGIHFLIEAVKSLNSRGRHIHLEIIGDGPERTALQELDHDTVFHGALNHTETLKVLSNAGLFVLPSFAEGVPIVLMEAMAFEIPCISTYVGGIPELIRDGLDGLLVYPSDKDGLEDAIERLIGDPSFARTLAASGKNRVVHLYNLDKNSNVLKNLFLLGGPHAHASHHNSLHGSGKHGISG